VDRHPNREMAVADLASLHPVGRIGDPTDIAATALWLASTDAGFVTGQVVAVDGGRMTRLSIPASLADDA